jgi:hypothetical protein
MQIKSFVYLLSAVSVVVAQTTQAILSNLAVLETRLTTLDNAINAFPNSGGSLVQALVSRYYYKHKTMCQYLTR